MTPARAATKKAKYRCNSTGLFLKIHMKSFLIINFTEEYHQYQHILSFKRVDTLESLLFCYCCCVVVNNALIFLVLNSFFFSLSRSYLIKQEN